MSDMGDPTGSRDAGESGEAVVASLISEVLGGDLVFGHTPGDAPQGIDLAYLDGEELHVGEVKSVIGGWHLPNTSATVDGRQMDTNWVADRMGRIGIDLDPSDIGTGADQVRTDLFQVDYPGGTIARYELDVDGRRTDVAPEEVWSLADVLEVHDANLAPEAAPADAPLGEVPVDEAHEGPAAG